MSWAHEAAQRRDAADLRGRGCSRTLRVRVPDHEATGYHMVITVARKQIPEACCPPPLRRPIQRLGSDPSFATACAVEFLLEDICGTECREFAPGFHA